MFKRGGCGRDDLPEPPLMQCINWGCGLWFDSGLGTSENVVWVGYEVVAYARWRYTALPCGSPCLPFCHGAPWLVAEVLCTDLEKRQS
jgi:hypothetical protein